MSKFSILAGASIFSMALIGCLMEAKAPGSVDKAAPGPSREQIKSSIEKASETSTFIHCREFPNGMRESYSLGVLNKKLEYLPQVAERLGTRTVSTCDEARRFMEIVQEDPANELVFPDDYADLAPAASAAGAQDAARVLAKQSLAGADVGNNRGTVRLFIGGRVYCTGFMVNPRAIVTSANCVDDFVDTKAGYVSMEVQYFDPKLTAGNSRPVGSGSMLVNICPTYAGSGDTMSDIAVITSPDPWPYTSSFDYLGLYYDSMADARYSYVWGAGWISDSQTDRQMRYERIYLDWYGDYHLTDDQYNYRVCDEDNGGPLIRDDEMDIAVTGITSNSDGSGHCGDQGLKARWTKVSSKALWVEDILQMTGLVTDCSLQRLPSGNRRMYMQCF